MKASSCDIFCTRWLRLLTLLWPFQLYHAHQRDHSYAFVTSRHTWGQQWDKHGSMCVSHRRQTKCFKNHKKARKKKRKKSGLITSATRAPGVPSRLQTRRLWEYAPSIWHPHQTGPTLFLQCVRYRTARFILSDYLHLSSVSYPRKSLLSYLTSTLND